MTRYPLQPLADLVGCPLAELGRRLGVSGSTWRNYRDRGVSFDVADRLATRAGFHPANVWPEWTDALVEGCEQPCAAPDCDVRFVPTRAGHVYCSATCRRRIAKRRELATPTGAARNRERRRRYYAENRQYEIGREARRYWADPERARERKRALRAGEAAA